MAAGADRRRERSNVVVRLHMIVTRRCDVPLSLRNKGESLPPPKRGLGFLPRQVHRLPRVYGPQLPDSS